MPVVPSSGNLDLVLGRAGSGALAPSCKIAVLNLGLGLGGVGLQRGLGRDNVFELVIRVVNRDQFDPQENRSDDDKNAEKQV